MKKIVNLCATALILSSATLCGAQAPPAAAPAAKPAVAPAVAAPAVAAPMKADKAGVMAPAWQATAITADKKKFSNADLKGQSYALVFVNSSCSDCRREMEDMMGMKFSDKLTVIVAAVDRFADRALAVYAGEMKVPYPIVEDSKFVVAQGFGIAFTPATVIVGADGKVEYWVAGYTDETNKATQAAFKPYIK
jgi:peroxiredoxin